jgi:hypothetical protein
LMNYLWTMPCPRCKTNNWLKRTQSGRNGGKQCRRSLKNKFKRVWTLFMQIKRPTWMNRLYSYYILRATSMIGSLANLVRYMLMFFKWVHLNDQLLWLQVLETNQLLPPMKNLNPSEEEQSWLLFFIPCFYPYNLWKYMLFLALR